MATDYDVIECETKEAWLAERRKGIGASEAAAVLGASPWKSAADVWAEKVGIAEPSEEETEAMLWGTRLEPIIREVYMLETERLVVQPGGPFAIVQSKKYPFLRTTLDGTIVPIDDRGPGVFEAKTASFFKREEWAEEPPLQYQIQNQHQLAVTGWTWGGDAVLIGGQRFLHTDFAANLGFQALLIQKLEVFWESVVKEVPPPVDGSDGAKDLLARLFPRQEPGKIVALPTEAMTWHQDLAGVKDELKRLKDREAELKNYLTAAIGDGEMGVLPSGDAYTWRLVEKKEYVVQPQSYRELRFKAKKGAK